MYFKVQVKKSNISGKGCFALSAIPGRRKIGELVGEVITVRQARERARKQKVIAIVELNEKFALDATNHENGFKYINHSCSPNTYMRVIRNSVEFYSLRNIAKGEELSCNYGETHHEGSLPCNCKSKFCKGFI